MESKYRTATWEFVESDAIVRASATFPPLTNSGNNAEAFERVGGPIIPCFITLTKSFVVARAIRIFVFGSFFSSGVSMAVYVI